MARIKKIVDTFRGDTESQQVEDIQHEFDGVVTEPAPPHVAHSLRSDLILFKIQALLAYSPTSGGLGHEGNRGDYVNFPREKKFDPLEDRRDRMLSALGGVDAVTVCSNHVEYYPQLEAAVDILAEAWGGGIPPYLYK